MQNTDAVSANLMISPFLTILLFDSLLFQNEIQNLSIASKTVSISELTFSVPCLPS